MNNHCPSCGHEMTWTRTGQYMDLGGYSCPNPECEYVGWHSIKTSPSVRKELKNEKSHTSAFRGTGTGYLYEIKEEYCSKCGIPKRFFSEFFCGEDGLKKLPSPEEQKRAPEREAKEVTRKSICGESFLIPYSDRELTRLLVVVLPPYSEKIGEILNSHYAKGIKKIFIDIPAIGIAIKTLPSNVHGSNKAFIYIIDRKLKNQFAVWAVKKKKYSSKVVL